MLYLWRGKSYYLKGVRYEIFTYGSAGPGVITTVFGGSEGSLKNSDRSEDSEDCS